MPGRLLLIDDDPDLCRFVEAGLGQRGFEVRSYGSADAGLRALDEAEFDVVLSDVQMEGMGGLELCERLATSGSDVPVIVITAFGSIETAVSAIRAGAYDFAAKPLDLDALGLTLARAQELRRMRRELGDLRQVTDRAQGFDEIVGASAPMRRVYELIQRVSASDASVLITGESGTGKELVARALHRLGRRRAGPFVAINCAAVPDSLLESELFGHAKGAFTDARAARSGIFVQASGGTLFLDEIAEMPLGPQSKLLRALQEKCVRPVGGAAEVPFDARVVAATNRDIESAVEEGRFRRDLFFRVNVLHIELPPLRSRGGDVLVLAQKFLRHFAEQAEKEAVELSTGAAEKLLGYDWPGNVRELMNCMERAVAVTQSERIQVEDLPRRIREHRAEHVLVAGDDPAELAPMEEVERRYVLRVLDAVHGNKSEAARILGFDRKTLYRKLERYRAAALEVTQIHKTGR